MATTYQAHAQAHETHRPAHHPRHVSRFVITGGPGVGKTTICDELAALGYEIVPEAARAIIEQEQTKPRGVLPWTDLYGFQHKVLDRQLAAEAGLNGHAAFLDRGLLDGIAYCREGSIKAPKRLEELAREPRYAKVFLLEPLPAYKTDAQRIEDAQRARTLHEEIGRVYAEHGYEVVRVPVLPPKERAQYIVARIRDEPIQATARAEARRGITWSA